MASLCALLALQGCSHRPGTAGEPPAAVSSTAAQVAALGVVQLPLVVDQGYPWVPGSVNGRRGRFMLDTGTPFRFFLNSGFAPVNAGPEIARGQAGSGQAVSVREVSDVVSLLIGEQASSEVDAAQPATVTGIKAADFGFIQRSLAPDFLGFIGAPWLSPFAFSLRYAPARWLVADAASGAQRLLQGSERVALIRFEGRDGPLPYATLTVGDVALRARFDTGTPGTLVLTPATWARLERLGALTCTAPAAASLPCQLRGLRAGTVELALNAIATASGPDDRITLGTALLAAYVSVWNFQEQTLDLRRDTPP